MKRLFVALAPILVAPAARADVPVAQGDNYEVAIGAMGQLLGFAEHVDDPYTYDDRVYLFMKEARLRSSGYYGDIHFNIEMALGGEDAIAAQTGVSLGLLDFSADIPIHAIPHTYLKVGQFKVPYGRERLTYTGDSQFLDRSLQDLGFRVGRDVGAAITSQPAPFTFIVGIFTGGGRDVPPDHYLPQRLGIPGGVARVGIGDVDVDPYWLRNDVQPTSTKAAFFVNGLYMKDSTVGHSSVLNVKLADKSILIDDNWNPYIHEDPLERGDWWQVGADGALRTPLLGGTSLSAEAEVNYGAYSNEHGSLHISGGRVQAGIAFKPFEIALRYSVLFPDEKFANTGVPITGSNAMQEITPTATWYVKGQDLKLVADMPVLVHVPVFVENGIGAYVATELQDQATVLASGGTVDHQDIVQARLMLQARF